MKLFCIEVFNSGDESSLGVAKFDSEKEFNEVLKTMQKPSCFGNKNFRIETFEEVM